MQQSKWNYIKIWIIIFSTGHMEYLERVYASKLTSMKKSYKMNKIHYENDRYWIEKMAKINRALWI